MKEPQTKILLAGYTNPLISLYSLVLNYFCVPLWLTQKMQNKPKLKTAKIPIIPFMTSTNKKGLRSPQPKNKPKQSQLKARRRESPDYFRNSVCHLSPLFCHPGPRAGIQNKISYPAQRWAGFRNFDICTLLFNMIFMTNKPNLKTSKNVLSPFIHRTKNYELRTAEGKNKPNSKPIALPALMCRILELTSGQLRRKGIKQDKGS